MSTFSNIWIKLLERFLMIEVNFTMQGSNRVRNQLRTIAALHPELTDPVIEKHVKKESARMRKEPYPPKLPNQKYVRTGTLGRSFRAQHVKLGMWQIINRATNPRGRQYAAWVIKKGFQNKQYHLGRWWTIEEKLQKNMPILTKKLSIMLERELDRQPD